MSENASHTLKFVRSATLPVVTNLPLITSPKSSHHRETPLLSSDKPMIPLSPLNHRESPSFSTSFNPPEVSSPSKDKEGQYTPRTARILLNEKILGHLDRLISERPPAYKSSKGKDKPVFRRGFTTEFENLSRDQKIQEVFEACRKFLGLEEGAREKLFDSKFDIFRQVKTFIDAKKLFQDNGNSMNSPSSPKLPQEISTFVNTMRAVGNNSPTKSMRSMSPNRSPSPSKMSQPGTPRSSGKRFGKTEKFFFATPRNNTKKRESLKMAGLLSPVSIGSKEDEFDFGLKRDASLAERKDLEIRQLYKDLKQNAIEKFGPGIFEKAKKRLKDPEQLKKVEMQRKVEVEKMRKMKEELSDFEIGTGLINTLNQQAKGDKLPAEINDKFNHYIENPLPEESSDEDSRTSPLPQINGLYSPNGSRLKIKLGLGIKMEQEKPKRNIFEDDPQVQLLQKAQYLQEKGDKVLKMFRTKIVKASKGDAFHGSLTTLNKPKKVKYALAVSQGDLSEPALQKQVPSIVMHTREPFSQDKFGSKLVNGGQEQFMRSGLKLGTKIKSQTDVEFPNIWNDEIFGKVQKDVNKAETEKKMASLKSQKNLLFDICHSLANLSTTSRQLNQELKASIKEMDVSYAKKAKTLKNLDIPESLLKPIPNSFVKSPTKVTAALTGKICRTRKLE